MILDKAQPLRAGGMDTTGGKVGLGLTSGIPPDTVLSEGQRHPSWRVERDTGSAVDKAGDMRLHLSQMQTFHPGVKSWAYLFLILHPCLICVVKDIHWPCWLLPQLPLPSCKAFSEAHILSRKACRQLPWALEQIPSWLIRKPSTIYLLFLPVSPSLPVLLALCMIVSKMFNFDLAGFSS